jgi:hypothetical protein
MKLSPGSKIRIAEAKEEEEPDQKQEEKKNGKKTLPKK